MSDNLYYVHLIFTELKLRKFENFDSFLGVFVLCHHGQDPFRSDWSQIIKEISNSEVNKTDEQRKKAHENRHHEEI